MEQSQQIRDLFKRFLLNQCTEAEIQLLTKYLGAEQHEALLKDLIKAELESSKDKDDEAPPDLQDRLNELLTLLKARIQKGKDS